MILTIIRIGMRLLIHPPWRVCLSSAASKARSSSSCVATVGPISVPACTGDGGLGSIAVGCIKHFVILFVAARLFTTVAVCGSGCDIVPVMISTAATGGCCYCYRCGECLSKGGYCCCTPCNGIIHVGRIIYCILAPNLRVPFIVTGG